MSKSALYRISFFQQGQVYELFAERVVAGEIFGFIEVADLRFGERSKLVVDPSEERLKSEFEGVRRFQVPLHAVIRIDEVERGGVSRILEPVKGRENVAPFPVPIYSPKVDPGGS